MPKHEAQQKLADYIEKSADGQIRTCIKACFE
jgi:hypothetical protein